MTGTHLAPDLEGMRPKWFYWLVAACLVVLTVAAVLRLRWQPYAGKLSAETAMVDTWRGRVCVIGVTATGPVPVCFPMGHDTVAAIRSARARHSDTTTTDPLIREDERERGKASDTAH